MARQQRHSQFRYHNCLSSSGNWKTFQISESRWRYEMVMTTAGPCWLVGLLHSHTKKLGSSEIQPSHISTDRRNKKTPQ
uniref:Uncharacterized protein n=1 Tax=Octopus bimaculoides TaxID=37653 RepID=A0A0L8HHR5_OCTBM